MSNLSIHLVIGKRITLHARILDGANHQIDFDSDAFEGPNDAIRWVRVMTHIKHVLILDLARMVIDHSDDIRIIKKANYMLSRVTHSEMPAKGLTALVEFCADIALTE